MGWVGVSVAVHGGLLWLVVARSPTKDVPVARRTRVGPAAIVKAEDTPIVVEMIGGGGGSPASALPAAPRAASRAAHIGSTRARDANPWADVSIRTEATGTA